MVQCSEALLVCVQQLFEGNLLMCCLVLCLLTTVPPSTSFGHSTACVLCTMCRTKKQDMQWKLVCHAFSRHVQQQQHCGVGQNILVSTTGTNHVTSHGVLNELQA